MFDQRRSQLNGSMELTTTLKLTDLPNEVLYKIFSFFKIEEIMTSSKVCKRFNDISKTPSLWKIKRTRHTKLRNKRQVESFCKFFNNVPRVRKISFLRKVDKRANLEREGRQFNDLFKNLVNLRCLQTNFPLPLKIIPPSLKHLSFAVNSVSPDVFQQLPFLVDSSPLMLEYLGVIQLGNEDPRKFDYLLTGLIERCKLSLRLLSLFCKGISRPVMTSILNCHNLRVLRLFQGEFHENLMCDFSKLPELELLTIANFKFKEQFLNLPKNGFLKLKDFRFSTDQYMEAIDYDFIFRRFPNLNTFLVDFGSMYLCFNLLSHFLKFITNYNKLRNVGIGCNLYKCEEIFYIDIIKVQKIRNFDSVCLCKLMKPVKVSDSTMEKVKQSLNCSMCLRKMFDHSDCPC